MLYHLHVGAGGLGIAGEDAKSLGPGYQTLEKVEALLVVARLPDPGYVTPRRIHPVHQPIFQGKPIDAPEDHRYFCVQI